MKTLIQNTRVVSPDVDLPKADILIDNGVISDIAESIPAMNCDNVINGEGLITAPGFIDIHCHGRSNCDFCDATDEAFNTIGHDKLSDGVTGFLATTLSVAREDLREICRCATRYQNTNTNGALLLGVHLEGPWFNPKCAGAQNPAHLLLPCLDLVDELSQLAHIVKASFSPELEGGLEFTKGLCERGIMPSGGHCEADYDCFQLHRANGMKHLTHFCNVMTPVHHLRFGMVGGGLMSDDVFVEMICDGVHLCEPMIQLIARLKGPDRMMLITDAMRASGMPDGNYTLGGLPVIVKDGKATLTTGPVAGSTLRYHNSLRRLVRVTGLPLCQAIKATSWNQAQSLKLGKRGRLEKGYEADIVMLNDDLVPQRTICHGDIRWEA